MTTSAALIALMASADKIDAQSLCKMAVQQSWQTTQLWSGSTVYATVHLASILWRFHVLPLSLPNT
jgi:hypothetical protein